MTHDEADFFKYQLSLMCKKIGEKKFLARQGDFEYWLQSFQSTFTQRNAFPKNIRFRKNAGIKEIALTLNAYYWEFIERYVRATMVDPTKKLNHYKIAAATEHAIMMINPFQNTDETDNFELNAKFAFYVSMRLIFGWDNDNKKEYDQSIIIKLKKTPEIKAFKEEHLAFLNSRHIVASQFIVYSNMQTFRILDNWVKADNLLRLE